jgi:sec-independent protein translocase protein TatB
MVDIGFWEISLILVIALLVVGPERLPRMARTIGLWLGKGRQILNSVKADIDRELKADELKKLLEERSKLPEVHEFVDELNRDVEDATPPKNSDTAELATSKTKRTTDEHDT